MNEMNKIGQAIGIAMMIVGVLLLVATVHEIVELVTR